MKKTALIILVLSIFVLGGCGNTYKANRTNQEPNTLLACDRENNQYYDFIDTKKCMQPTTYEQLYVLDKFRRINELAAEDPEKVIEIQVNFKHYPTGEEFEALIDERVERVTYIGMFYPNFANGSGFPTYIRNESITKEQALQHVLDENKGSVVQWYDHSFAEDYDEFNDSMLDGYQVQGARLTMKQGDLPDWWLKHNSLVRVIQPIISDFDHVQTIFKPDEKIGPEDQSIDWEGVSKNPIELKNTTTTQQTDKEYFQPPISLSEVIEKMPNDSGITSLRVVESSDRELTVAFKEPSFQLEEVIENYQSLRTKEFEGMISSSLATLEQLQRDQGIDHSVYIDALNKDIENLQLLLQTPVTGDIKIREASYAKR